MSQRNPLTPEIITETLKRSSLKTVLVEGTDDVQVYRKIESRLGVRNFDILPCGGKNTLLEVFEKKHELDSTKIMFVADKDSWVFTNVPEEYEEIFFSKGYCLENDLFEDGSELILGLLDQEEQDRFFKIIENVSIWFAFEIEEMISKDQPSPFFDITLLSRAVIPDRSNEICDSFLRSRNCNGAKQERVEEIKNEYILKLRGKYLFQIFERLFQERPKKSVKYKRSQLFDMCFVEGTRDDSDPNNLNQLIDEIKKFIT